MTDETITISEENSKNTAKGRSFQIEAAKVLSDYFGVEFELDIPFLIGQPPKEHRFSLVSENRKIVGESKNYSWTKGSNVPSAKMSFINQAVFYLSFIPSDKTRFVVLRKDVHSKKGETIAEYYYRTYRHLLMGVKVLEIDLDTKSIRVIGRDIA